jgi:hypothetical protein
MRHCTFSRLGSPKVRRDLPPASARTTSRTWSVIDNHRTASWLPDPHRDDHWPIRLNRHEPTITLRPATPTPCSTTISRQGVSLAPPIPICSSLLRHRTIGGANGNESARRQADHAGRMDPRSVHAPIHDRVHSWPVAPEPPCNRAICLAPRCARAQPIPCRFRQLPVNLARRNRPLPLLRQRRQTVSVATTSRRPRATPSNLIS